MAGFVGQPPANGNPSRLGGPIVPPGADHLPIQVDVVLTPIIAYNVDVVHAHSAEVSSAHS